MTMSVNPSLSSLEAAEINVSDKEYLRAQTQREAYNLILERFAELSEDHVALRALIAKRLGKSRAQITRWLSEPSNITLDTLSDLLLAMGSEARMRQCPFGSEPKGNYLHELAVVEPTHDYKAHIERPKTYTDRSLNAVRSVAWPDQATQRYTSSGPDRSAKAELSGAAT